MSSASQTYARNDSEEDTVGARLFFVEVACTGCGCGHTPGFELPRCCGCRLSIFDLLNKSCCECVGGHQLLAVNPPGLRGTESQGNSQCTEFNCSRFHSASVGPWVRMVDSVAVQDASGRVVLEVARPTGRPRLPMGPRTRTLDWMVIIFYFRQGAAQELLGRFNSLTMCHGLLANPCR